MNNGVICTQWRCVLKLFYGWFSVTNSTQVLCVKTWSVDKEWYLYYEDVFYAFLWPDFLYVWRSGQQRMNGMCIKTYTMKMYLTLYGWIYYSLWVSKLWKALGKGTAFFFYPLLQLIIQFLWCQNLKWKWNWKPLDTSHLGWSVWCCVISMNVEFCRGGIRVLCSGFQELRISPHVVVLYQGEENTRRHTESGEVVLVTEHRILDSGNRKGHIVIRVSVHFLSTAASCQGMAK